MEIVDKVLRERIEPSTCALEGRCSILLSYRSILVAKVGLAPTRCCQRRILSPFCLLVPAQGQKKIIHLQVSADCFRPTHLHPGWLSWHCSYSLISPHSGIAADMRKWQADYSSKNFCSWQANMSREAMNYFIVPVGGFEPPKPKGTGFTDRGWSPTHQHRHKNFRWFARVPTSQWATTFALQGYLLLRFKCGLHCHTNKFVPTG